MSFIAPTVWVTRRTGLPSQPRVWAYAALSAAGSGVWHEGAEALRTLGNFYAKNGQRARLPQSVIDDVLTQLDRAENAILELK
jgi:hypothetical protein